MTTGKSTPDKKLMLLVHGFPELWAMWEHQMKYFRDKYTVAAIDMRGYGLSSRPSVRLTLTDILLYIYCFPHTNVSWILQHASLGDLFLVSVLARAT